MIRPKYNQSELKAYLKCGKLWEFRYLRGIRIPPSTALTLGSSVDAAVTANLVQKIDSGEDLSREAVLDRFSDEFDRRESETEWGDDLPGRQKDLGVKLVDLHHEAVAPRIQPESVQENFTIETDAGYDLHGTIDHVETDGTVVDTKTSRLAYAPDAVEKSFQPTLYDFAYEATRGKPAKGFRYDVLVKPTATKPARLQQVSSPLTRTDREWVFDAIQQVHKAIQAGVALPAPEGSWYCSPKWCGYWNQCKGKKAPEKALRSPTTEIQGGTMRPDDLTETLRLSIANLKNPFTEGIGNESNL